MSKFIGVKCIVCENDFEKDDDIVVCPDCGTPYHRQCYKKEEKCINVKLHEENLLWQSEAEAGEPEEIRCRRCGESNPVEDTLCKACGTQLHTDEAPYVSERSEELPPHPFGNIQFEKITAETEIDGIKLKDMGDYVGQNQAYYLPNFVRFAKTKSKMSINFTAALFPEIFYFYRKMYLWGILLFVLRIVFIIPYLETLRRFGYVTVKPMVDWFSLNISDKSLDLLYSAFNAISTALSFACGFFTNWLYYRHTVKNIKRIKQSEFSDEVKANMIKAKGGVSSTAFAATVTIAAVLVMFMYFFFE